MKKIVNGNIYNYEVTQDFIVYECRTSNQIVSLDNGLMEYSITSPFSRIEQILKGSNNCLAILDEKLFPHFYNLPNFTAISPSIQLNKGIDSVITNDTLSFNNLFFRRHGDSKLGYSYGVYSLANNSFQLLDLDFVPVYDFENCVIGLNNSKELCLFDINLNCLRWSFKTASLGEYINAYGREVTLHLEKVLGVFQSILWVRLGGNTLLGVNITTGKTEYFLQDFFKSSGWSSQLLNCNTGILQIFEFDEYKEFNLSTLALEKNIKIRTDKKLQFVKATFYDADSSIYFCGCYGESFPNSIGIFDPVKGSCTILDVLDDSDTGNAFYFAPKCTRKYVVVLDNLQNMRIYNKPSQST